MSKMVKDYITSELRDRYADLDSALWIEMTGIDGNTNNAFRHDLHKKSIRVEIVKNSLLRRAVADGSLAPLAKKMCGPAALVTGGESIIDVAKVIDEWVPKLKDKIKLRGAVLEGEYIDEQAVQTLHKMPSKSDLQAKIAGATLSPGSRLSSAILSGGANIAGCLKTIIKKLEDGEEIKAA